jgi:hypothetical protein
MTDMAGWRQVTCREADVIRRQGAGLQVASGLTDLGGQYGRPIVFTEWWWDNEPVLREYRYPLDDGTPCGHWIAASDEAADREDDAADGQRP